MQMSTSTGGGKVSFFLTLQLTSPRLTYQMMESINFGVDEIVTSRDNALTYVYIHLLRKVRTEELGNALMTLGTTHGVTGSNIFGYDTVNGNSKELCDFIEDHPGFKTLVHHESTCNENFYRWTAEDYSGARGGYSLLKNRLLGKRISAQQTSSGAGASPAAAGGRNNTRDEEVARVVPPPSGGSVSDDDEDQNTTTAAGGKRRRLSVTMPPPSAASDPVGMFNYMKDMSDIREKVVRLEYELQRANENASRTIVALQTDLATTMSIVRGETEVICFLFSR